jgi:hypothetical protein
MVHHVWLGREAPLPRGRDSLLTEVTQTFSNPDGNPETLSVAWVDSGLATYRALVEQRGLTAPQPGQSMDPNERLVFETIAYLEWVAEEEPWKDWNAYIAAVLEP